MPLYESRVESGNRPRSAGRLINLARFAVYRIAPRRSQFRVLGGSLRRQTQPGTVVGALPVEAEQVPRKRALYRQRGASERLPVTNHEVTGVLAPFRKLTRLEELPGPVRLGFRDEPACGLFVLELPSTSTV